MGQVTVSIDEKVYRLACDDGQEQHLATLAAGIDARIKGLRQSFGEIGDMRLMVMTTILLADEVADLKRGLAAAQADAGSAAEAIAAEQRAGANDRRAIVAAIAALAERIETISRELEASES